MVLALGWAYVVYGGLSWMQTVFYGVGASVMGIIAVSAYRLTAKTIGRDALLWAIYGLAFAITVITESEIAWVFIAAGVVAWLVKTPPSFLKSGIAKGAFLTPLAAAAVPQSQQNLLWTIFLFFMEAGAFVFGSGLAIIPFLYGGVVKEHGWLNDRQFIDAVAVAMITPGPVVITVAFIGYLVAGLWGAVVAAIATYLPCYVFTVVPAPYFRKYGRRPDIAAFVSGVTAAATGAISGAVVVLSRRSILDLPTAILAIATALLLLKTKRVPEPAIIAAAAIIGLVLRWGSNTG
jgi:chromate transporter